MDFNIRLKEIRKERGFTQAQIANRLSVVESCYANWEQGRTEPSIKSIKELVLIFGVSADYLLGLEDESGLKSFQIKTQIDTNYGTINNY